MMAVSEALKLKADKVGIIDCDAHYGDGTADIIEKTPYFTIRHRVSHFTAGRSYKHPYQVEEFLDVLESKVTRMCRTCDVILYQAGADPHIDDPLGGFLTTEQMRVRDRIVFDIAAAYGKPLVWNFAGGYQHPVNKVVELHVQSMRVALEAQELREAA